MRTSLFKKFQSALQMNKNANMAKGKSCSTQNETHFQDICHFACKRQQHQLSCAVLKNQKASALISLGSVSFILHWQCSHQQEIRRALYTALEVIPQWSLSNLPGSAVINGEQVQDENSCGNHPLAVCRPCSAHGNSPNSCSACVHSQTGN